jgi:rod shape-determining protein MreC
MEHHPPPFFKRGPAPLALLTFYAAVSLALLVVDARFHTLDFARQALSVLTHPLQQFAQAPVHALNNAGSYFASVAALQDENGQMKRSQIDSAATLLRTEHLEAENQRLRRLLGVKEREAASGLVSQIIYAARDPFSRRIVVDRGQQDGVTAGRPVIDESGIVGQVTRVFPFVSEVTLITDKDQAIPVQLVRNGLRSVVFGLGNGQLELRFMPANADVQNGDLLVTSGLDGIFLAGFPVAKVVHIERDASYSFARIYCVPSAGVENFGDVMVLAIPEARPLPEGAARESAGDSEKPGDKSARGKKKRLKRD